MKKEVIIEIPKGSKIKYEIDTKTNELVVDRILFGSNIYPYNYGYLENTLDYDGDALDVLVISNEALLPKSRVPTRIIGAMKMIDDGETDTKLISIIDVDPRFSEIKKMSDLPKHILEEIKNFFETYKKLQNKAVIVEGYEDINYAKNIYSECYDLYQKYSDLKKDDFIKKMKIEHPNKYKK